MANSTRTSDSATSTHPLDPTDDFPRRHLGPDATEAAGMLAELGLDSIDSLISEAIPAAIRDGRPLSLRDDVLYTTSTSRVPGEQEALSCIRGLAEQNEVWRSYIGMGYHGTITPSVILRTVLENPCWYTQYTPYQAEIAQGRLQALLNFQTMIADLTAMPLANASLLDEATAAAEAMSMCATQTNRSAFFVADDCHPQTIGVIETRAKGLGIEVRGGGGPRPANLDSREFGGGLVQYPADRRHASSDYTAALAERAHAAGAHARWWRPTRSPSRCCKRARASGAPTSWSASSAALRRAVGSSAGPTRPSWPPAGEALVRGLPGRLIGVSRDVRRRTARCAWRFRPASSTSAAIGRPATSARRRSCWPMMAGLYGGVPRSRTVCGTSRAGSAGCPATLAAGLRGDSASRDRATAPSSTRIRVRRRGRRARPSSSRPGLIEASTCAPSETAPASGISLDETGEAAEVLARLVAVFGSQAASPWSSTASAVDLRSRSPRILTGGQARVDVHDPSRCSTLVRTRSTTLLRYIHRTLGRGTCPSPTSMIRAGLVHDEAQRHRARCSR